MKVSGINEQRKLFRRSTKGRTVVKISCVHSSTKVSKPRKGQQKIIQVQAGNYFNMNSARAQARKEQPPSFTVTTSLTVYIKPKVINPTKLERFVTKGD